MILLAERRASDRNRTCKLLIERQKVLEQLVNKKRTRRGDHEKVSDDTWKSRTQFGGFRIVGIRVHHGRVIGEATTAR